MCVHIDLSLSVIFYTQLPPAPQIELIVDKPHLSAVVRRPLVRIRRESLAPHTQTHTHTQFSSHTHYKVQYHLSDDLLTYPLAHSVRLHARIQLPPHRRSPDAVAKNAPWNTVSTMTYATMRPLRSWRRTQAKRTPKARWRALCRGDTAGAGRRCRTACGMGVSGSNLNMSTLDGECFKDETMIFLSS